MYKSLQKDNEGVALITVIMTMLVLFLLVAATLNMTTSNVKNSLEEREFQASYYIAEAGANYGMEYYKTKLINTETTAPILLNVASGHFTEQYGDSPEANIKLIGPESGATPEEEVYKIESTGTVDGISRTVIKPFILKRTTSSGGDPSWKSEYAVYTEGDMAVKGGTITGPIFSNNNLLIDNGGAKINGNAYSTGNMTINQGKIDGDVYSLGDMAIKQGVISDSVYTKGNLKIEHSNANISKDAHSMLNMTITQGVIKGRAYSNGNLLLNHSNSKIQSDAYSKGTITITSGTIGGTQYNEYDGLLPQFPLFPEPSLIPDPSEEDSPPIFPDFPEITSDITESSIKTTYEGMPWGLELDKPVTYIPEIDVTGGRDLTIQYNSNDILMVDDFKIGEGHVDLVCLDGNGLLNIYVRNNLEITGSSTLNYIDSPNEESKRNAAENLSIYIKGDSNSYNKTFKVPGSATLYGSVFAEDANIDLGNSGKSVGNYITLGYSNVKITGSSSAIAQRVYAPNAHVFLGGSGKLNGAIVANTFEIAGSAVVYFDPNDPNQQPVDDPFFPPKTEGSIVIEPGPVTEK